MRLSWPPSISNGSFAKAMVGLVHREGSCNTIYLNCNTHIVGLKSKKSFGAEDGLLADGEPYRVKVGFFRIWSFDWLRCQGGWTPTHSVTLEAGRRGSPGF